MAVFFASLAVFGLSGGREGGRLSGGRDGRHGGRFFLKFFLKCNQNCLKNAGNPRDMRRFQEEILPQVEEFKYLGVLFMSEGRMEQEIDRQIRITADSAPVRRGEEIYRSIFVPTLTYGHELWVMTERTRSRVQAAEMSFSVGWLGPPLERGRSSAILEELGVEPLLLRVERSQMRWLGHRVRMPPGPLPGEVFRVCPSGRRPPGRRLGTPRMSWRR
ncbi:hypothetical protein D4764_01G0021710 [Takifugu flavidus]|uniref:Transcription factor COE DNA-binding domain-containing protein n=1 Tax=Takifugu flavidus TaxID=433684 RepID=A0A5C6PTF6_9TELE|nr:hypothetical protein D4764_01G0021710 [Takifugu flavidus]